MKEITQEQKEQLLNLNDSRVNEILGVKKLEVGKWYKGVYEQSEWLLLYQGGEMTYGFWDGYFSVNYEFSKDGDVQENSIEATHEELENVLIEEAKRRGFKGGFNYDNVYNEFWCNSEMIFSKGNWDKPKANKQEIINQINELLKQL